METNLYRHYDAKGALLYVGISLDALARLRQHKKSSWSQHIVRVEIEIHPTRRDAERAERHAIKTESPIFNKVHNGGRKDYNGAGSDKKAPISRGGPQPLVGGDEWLSSRRVAAIVGDIFHGIPPDVQMIAKDRLGKNCGGHLYWKQSSLERALRERRRHRLEIEMPNEINEGRRFNKKALDGLDRNLFTDEEWERIEQAA